MKLRRVLVAVAFVSGLQAGLVPGHAQAHYSSYCGHGRDGYTTVTEYVYGWNDHQGHWHGYRHYRWGTYEEHYPESRLCPH